MKPSTLVLTTILLILTSCVKEQTEPSYFTATPRSASVAAEGGEMTIQVETDFTWKASVKSGRWLHVKSTDKQDPVSIITLNADCTDDFDIRRDTLIVKSGSSSIEIPVIQQGLSSIVSPSSIILKETATVALAITAPFKWTAKAGGSNATSSWFSITPESGKAGSSIIKVTATDPNINVGDRTSFIRMSMGEMNFNINVTQKQKDALLLSADKVEIPDKQSSFEVICRSNVEYSVTIDADSRSWLSAGNSGTKALNEETFLFNVKANEGDTPRKGTITFYGAGLSETLTVCQAEKGILAFEKDIIEADSKGGDYSVDLRTNIDYTVSMEGQPDWVRVTAPSSVRTDKLYISIDSNNSYSERTAFLTVRDRNSDLSQMLTIKQSQNNAIILDYSELRIRNRKESFTVNVKSNVNYEVHIPESDKRWLSIVSTKALDQSSVSFLAEANDSDEARISDVVFCCGDAADTLRVIQAERDRIVIDPQTAKVEFYGGQVDINIISNVEYGVTVDERADWISRLRGDNIISCRETFRIEENRTGELRKGCVYLNGAGSIAADTLTVIQSARPSGTFLDSHVPGSYGTSGPDWKYRIQMSQISNRRQGDGLSFIMLFPKDRNVLELNGLPETFTPGDRMELERISFSQGSTSSRKGNAVVLQCEGELVWLSFGEDEKYIIKLTSGK